MENIKKEYLTPAEVEERYRIPVKTQNNLRHTRKLGYFKLGGKVRYSVQQIEDYLQRAERPAVAHA